MAKSMGKTIANIVILSAITLSCAAVAIGFHAMNKNAQVDPTVIDGSEKEGRSIVKIEKTKTLGLIDEYTITYSDNTTSTFLVTNGKDGTEGIQGLPGADGHTPTIAVGANGNWVVDGVDLGIRAEGLRGPQGEAGRGIVSIDKTNTYGQIDEYTITYTDNTTSIFLVTNGTNGEPGIQGFPGTNGHTPTIAIGTNGNWFVDEVDTGICATGPAGQNGANGKSAYELAVDNGYSGTLEEWLLSLVGAAGAVGPTGANGKSAYELAVENGYIGTETEWLTSLIGAAGQNGQNGQNGMSAYQIYCEGHLDPDLSEPEWIASLYGQDGQNGMSAYEIYISLNPGSTLSESEWLESLVGANGTNGTDGRGIASITGPETSGSYDTYTITYTDGSTPTQFVVKNGADGLNGASLLTGPSDPLPTDGNSGDSYINTTTWEYFTKDGNTWTSKGSIRGTDGTNGTNGTNGTDGIDGKSLSAGDGVPTIAGNSGDSYIDLSTGDYYLHNGTNWALAANIKGADGATGATGQDGRGITTIALTDDTASDKDEYTITYSDGTSFSYWIAKPKTIVSFAKTSSDGLVDTYTITYSYGESSTFTVTNGADGKTIYHGEGAPDNAIGTQGDVYIDTHNLNMYFKGMSSWGDPINFKGANGTNGVDGVGISSITKTGTSGLVDTYTIAYTNGDETTFTVTNGANGKDGTKVVTGAVAPTSTTGFQEGDSYINTANWDYYVLILNGSDELEWDLRGNIRGAQGSNGADGTNGTNGTKIVTGNTAPTSTVGYQVGDSYIDTSTWNFYVLGEDAGGNPVWGEAVGNIHNSPNTYVVTFDSDGGSAVSSIDEALEGRPIAKPLNPTKDDFFFEGWYTEEGTRWDFSKDVVTSSITLTARWGQLEVTNGVLTGCSLIGDVEIPYSYDGEIIHAISADVFKGNMSLTGIKLPATITEIPDHAFEDCQALENVSLPETILSIGERAFSNCQSLMVINLPDTIDAIGKYAFYYCFNLPAVALPTNLTTLEEGVFSTCVSLAHIVIPDGSVLSTIEAHAFDDCHALEELILPDSVTSIAENCIAGDYFDYIPFALETLSVPFIGFGDSGDKGIKDFFNGTTVPDTLYSVIVTGNSPVFEGAFDGCENVKEVMFTGTPSSFAQNCLRGLENIEGLSLPYLGETSNSTSTTKSYLGHLFGASSDSGHSSYVPGSLYGVEVRGGKIGAYAFRSCGSLHYLIFGKNVTEFEKHSGYGSDYGGRCESLYGCSGLEYLEIPFVGITRNATGQYYTFFTCIFGCSAYSSSSHYIPDCLEEVVINNAYSIPTRAFYGCSHIRSVTLNDRITSIGSEAFYDSGIESIVIPDSVSTINSSAFAYCPSLTYAKLPNNPSFTTLGSGAFSRCTALEAIVIPDSVVTIGNSAFNDCDALISVDLGNGVTTIGNYGFYSCEALKNLRIGNSLQSIGEEAFNWCRSLESLYIPKSVTYIGKNAFNQCIGLRDLVFENPYNGDELTIDRWAFMHCRSLISVVLPDRTVTIDMYAFSYCDSLTYIYIPSNCTTIGEQCFHSDYNLQSITFPDGASLGYVCLSDCTSLTSVTLSSIPTGDSSYKGMSYLFGGQAPESLKTVILEGNVYDLPDGAFQQLGGVTTIVLPNSVETIGPNAFRDCYSLTRINIPRRVSSIGEYAFQNCYSLVTVTGLEDIDSDVDERVIGRYAFQNCYSLTCLRINNLSKDLTIRDQAFEYCDGLSYVEIYIGGGAVLDVGYGAFRSCNGLTSVYFGSSNDAKIILGTYAFQDCKSLTYLGISANTKDMEIGSYAFQNCYSLLFVENNSKDLVIGTSAFARCRCLRYFTDDGTSNGTIKSIDSSAFNGCWSLETIRVNGLTSLGSYAFGGCYALKSISLPDTVTSMSYGVFYGCTGLESVKLPHNASVYILSESTFYNCTSLKSFEIPDTITRIDAYAFSGSGLESIVIPDTVTLIKNGVFSNCASLRSVKLPENASITEINYAMFSGCTSLESIRIPENITTIGQNAFYGCTSLKTMTIIINSSKVLYTGQNAFYNCELTTINFTGTQSEYEAFTTAPGANTYLESGNDAIKNTAPGLTVNYNYVEA